MIGKHGIEDLLFSFETAEAHEWYDPLKDYTRIEYEWVRQLPLDGQLVADVGCHHGNYAVVFQGCEMITCIDMVDKFADICRRNLELNDMRDNSIVVTGEIRPFHGLYQITHARPDIYKMDIEGMEFQVFPREFDEHPQVHTWIVEIHPQHGDPNEIAKMFKMGGMELLKVYRNPVGISAYHIGEDWPTHATLIARKPRPYFVNKAMTEREANVPV